MYTRIYKKGKNTACAIFCVEEKISALSTSSSSTRHAKARRPCKPSRWTRWSLRSRSPECKFQLGGPRHLRQHPPSHDHLLLSASLKRLWWGRTKSGLVFTAGWLCSGFKSSGSTARVEGHQSLETKCISLVELVKNQQSHARCHVVSSILDWTQSSDEVIEH